MSSEGKVGDGERDTQTICLFDVDGTLSPSRKVATDEMKVKSGLEIAALLENCIPGCLVPEVG